MTVFLIVILFLSIAFHECAHGWVAYKLGDPTPKYSGRLTLNPIAHIDPFGTIILPLLLLLASKGTFAIGYAKPVPINTYHFKNPKKDIRWVGAAGPMANFSIALFLTIILKTRITPFSDVLLAGIFINLILSLFNLIPIPPLDGSKILASLLPNHIVKNYLKLEPYGFIIILGLVMTGFFQWFIVPLAFFILQYVLQINIIP